MIATDSAEFFEYIKPYKSRDSISLICPHCKCIFTRTKNVIQSKLGAHNNEKTIYCSRKCFDKQLITKQKVNCLQCNKLFEKVLNQIKKFPNHFCSRSCAGKYNAAHKTKGNRRSKLEIWLENQLTKLFPTLKIIYNQRDTINAELDIYIPNLKFLLRIQSYLFIMNPYMARINSLTFKQMIIENFELALEKNIELVILACFKERYFKETSSRKYLNTLFKISLI